MSAEIEQAILTWTKIGAVGQIAGAIATAAAVIVSLWIVLSERRERIDLNVGHRLLLAGDTVAEWIELCAFDVTNTGQRQVQITGVGWRIGWSRRGPNWLRYRYAVQFTNDLTIGSAPTPLDLDVGRRAVFSTRMTSFDRSTPAVPDLFDARLLPFGFKVYAPIAGQVFTSRGTTVVSKIEPTLRRKLIERVAGRSDEPTTAA